MFGPKGSSVQFKGQDYGDQFNGRTSNIDSFNIWSLRSSLTALILIFSSNVV